MLTMHAAALPSADEASSDSDSLATRELKVEVSAQSPLHVAFLTTEYPTERFFAGGLATYLRRTAYSLHDLGHRPEVFTISHENGTVKDGEIPVHRVARCQKTFQAMTKLPFLWRYNDLALLLANAWSLASRLRQRHAELPFDVVQTANYRACGLFTALRPVAPVVTRVSSYEPMWREAYAWPITGPQRLIERAEIRQCRSSTAIYAPSRLIADVLSRKERIPTRVLAPPYDLESFDAKVGCCKASPRPHPYMLFFGTIGRMKGCDRLAEILSELLLRNPEMRFLFVGRISQRPDGERYDSYIRRYAGDFENRVEILSEIRHNELLPLVANARVVTLPSRIDNLPNACMEAMALRRVVVATKDASFEELISDGWNGFLVPQDDHQALLETLHDAWHLPPEERSRMGDLARESLQRLAPDVTILPLLRLFQEVSQRSVGSC